MHPSQKPGLNEYARNVNSQKGEDGIIQKILDIIGVTNAWCVEFGAWDGVHLSNVRNLIVNQDFSAVFIEGDADRFRSLRSNYQANDRVTLLNAFVGFDADNNLDTLLASTQVPESFDVLSIDIDGNDYHVWEAAQRYRPRLVVIEFNPTIPNEVDFVQPRDMSVTQGSSIRALARLGKQKGYELVAATQFNAFFVEASLYNQFGIQDNAVQYIRTEQPDVSYIFHGFDGRVFVRGARYMAWHGFDYDERRLQQLPFWLRGYPGNYGRLKKRIFRWYRAYRKRRASRR